MENIKSFREACKRISKLVDGAVIEDYPDNMDDECYISFRNMDTGNMENITLNYDGSDGGYSLEHNGYISDTHTLHVDSSSDIDDAALDELFL